MGAKLKQELIGPSDNTEDVIYPIVSYQFISVYLCFKSWGLEKRIFWEWKIIAGDKWHGSNCKEKDLWKSVIKTVHIHVALHKYKNYLVLFH